MGDDRSSDRWVGPVMLAYENDVDLSQLRENLELSVEERWRKLMDLQRFAEEMQRAGPERR